MSRNPHYFHTYKPGSLRKGKYSKAICPQAQWARDHIMAVPLNQYTSERHVRDFGRALDKIFSSLAKC